MGKCNDLEDETVKESHTFFCMLNLILLRCYSKLGIRDGMWLLCVSFVVAAVATHSGYREHHWDRANILVDPHGLEMNLRDTAYKVEDPSQIFGLWDKFLQHKILELVLSTGAFI